MIKGVLPIAPTIFTDTGVVDVAGTLRVCRYIADVGASGMVFPGLASEFDHLTGSERLMLTAAIGDFARSRELTFIVGASSEDVAETIEFARAGRAAGAYCAMILTPKAHSDDQAQLAQYFERVSAETDFPIMVQNAPPPMGLGLSASAVAELGRQIPGIRYVKEEAQPSGQRVEEIAKAGKASIHSVFGGAGARNLIDELGRGAMGTMPACELTELHVAIMRAWSSGDRDHARRLFERSLPLLTIQAVFRWRLTKEVLAQRGIIDCTFVRAPGPVLDEHDRSEITIWLSMLADVLHAGSFE